MIGISETQKKGDIFLRTSSHLFYYELKENNKLGSLEFLINCDNIESFNNISVRQTSLKNMQKIIAKIIEVYGSIS